MPMPTVKQTEDFYDMLVAAARRKRARMAMDAEPVGTPPDAPGGEYTNKLIAALHDWATAELTPEQTAALQTLIENNTDQRGAVAKDDKPPASRPKASSARLTFCEPRASTKTSSARSTKFAASRNPPVRWTPLAARATPTTTQNNSRALHASSAMQPCAYARSTRRPAARLPMTRCSRKRSASAESK